MSPASIASKGKSWYARNDNAQRRHTKHRSGALRRLGLTPAQANGTVRISHILDHAEGGMATVIAALRLCEDSDARAFLDKYDSLSKTDLGYLSVEEISLGAGVGPKRLLELAVSALVEDSQSAGKIIAATFHPHVIRATAEWAMGPLGYNDRKLFLSGSGFTPQAANRTGGVFSPNIFISNQMAQQVEQEVNTPTEAPMDKFNAAEDDLKLFHEELDGARLLEAPKTVSNAGDIKIGHIYHDQEDELCTVKPR